MKKKLANTGGRAKRNIWIGGPGSKLPFWLESSLSWIFAISCLGVAFRYWLQQFFFHSLWPFSLQKSLVPLMTHSRHEIEDVPILKRYQQLAEYLQTFHCISIQDFTKEDIICVVRKDHIVRRLVSLIRLKFEIGQKFGRQPIPDIVIDFIKKIDNLWPQFLPMPALPPESAYPYHISVVTSAFCEDGRDLLMKLKLAMDNISSDSVDIEWILVDAGQCSHLDDILSSAEKIRIVKGEGGGRGPSLNQGAALAKGRILTFLHADTRLSPAWDRSIREAFYEPNTTAAAFSFAIDTSSNGLQGMPFPPGIKAIETTANWRSHLFSLPYGDQCISIPKQFFDYIGGYPNQCLMEDYELISLLRHRRHVRRENLAILSQSAFCGPRRWQRHGVLYVTYTNSRCVKSYANGSLSPEGLYEIYYGYPCKSNSSLGTQSPWEVDLQSRLAHAHIREKS